MAVNLHGDDAAYTAGIGRPSKNRFTWVDGALRKEGSAVKKVTCDCGAEFKTHTEDELYEIIKIHGKTSHKMDIKREDARKMMKDA